MPPLFHPTPVNGPFDDPGVYVDFLFERRAILFDLGDITPLPPRKVLRISDIFVSHTHVDHFIGLDRVVRLCLGREKRLRLYGPPGFTDQVAHRLASYTWNLVESYPTDFTVEATELAPGGGVRTVEFHCRREFVPESESWGHISNSVILDEETFRVRAAFLDHGTPCLAFALEEKLHVNVRKNRLEEMGLPTGEWLRELKKAILRGERDDLPFRVWWREGGQVREKIHPLGELRERLVGIVPGQRVVYVTDAGLTPENGSRIVELAREADYLFIETTFLHAEEERARQRSHLTARQAGELAREAGVARVVPFHFSPKYRGMEEMLRTELEEAFFSEKTPETQSN
ncbi:ribonuclease Z [Geobacter grbiciae]|uniref:ribonuclease Z n=1 Tax=Geobacter grbiciae TaxID=155042 RepID=UPI001C0100D3|nr:MBL fold metallo-hydrolase [Geobacter grbiciae]MBT1076214.1 ribonuclease Z [Geobacter grbiciae]